MAGKKEIDNLPFTVGDYVKNRYNGIVGEVISIEKMNNGYVMFSVMFKDGTRRPYEEFEIEKVV